MTQQYAPATAPTSTYRLQLHPGFTFGDAEAAVPYLASLGVSHLHLSPVLEAVPGSAHGYDVVDHGRVRAELGGEPGLRALARTARGHGLGLVLDIVPNHMAVPSPLRLNRPLWEVLREGPGSPYARWFDIDWAAGGGQLLLPVLGGPPEPERLRVDGGLLRYEDHEFPLRAGTEGLPLPELLAAQWYRAAWWREARTSLNYRRFFTISELIGVRVEEPEVFAATHAKVLELVRDGVLVGLRIDHVDGLADPEGYLRRLRGAVGGGCWVVVEKILAREERLPGTWPVAGTTGYDALHRVDGVFVDPSGADALAARYRATTGSPDWPTVATRSAASVLTEDLAPELSALLRLAATAAMGGAGPAGPGPAGGAGPAGPGPVGGAPAGAEPPAAGRAGPLGAGPAMCAAGPAGPSPAGGAPAGLGGAEPAGGAPAGAEPAAAGGAGALGAGRAEGAAGPGPVGEASAGAEPAAAGGAGPLRAGPPEGGAGPGSVDAAPAGAGVAGAVGPDPVGGGGELVGAVGALLVGYPVYRPYPGGGELAPEAVARARETAGAEAVERVRALLRASPAFAARFAQTSAALRAKSLEDRAFYRYAPLLSATEVGGDPGRPAVTPAEFHAYCAHLEQDWPASGTVLSTHDTKRSADVRARIAALSERPDALRLPGGPDGPGPGDPQLAWVAAQSALGLGAVPDGPERLAGALLKAAKEAALRTSWTDPDPAYEETVPAYADHCAGPGTGALAGLAPAVRANTLGATALQLAMPGVPEVYQGGEAEYRALVDPDNRRPARFHRETLARLDAGSAPAGLSEEKLALTAALLRLRRSRPGLFRGYAQLAADGPAAEHCLAFTRADALLVAVTRLALRLAEAGGWRDTALPLPPGRWTSAFARSSDPYEGTVALSVLLGPGSGDRSGSPVAVLVRE
ncbi:malto-oligosyltrehalose synthase [Streptomyces sp. NPDC002054]|uniref:malto-oligosyltrehalose synthase n=1 Tax=Streptomyces sp. NPDC002054 TaxID=3154663 RepID=UPI0033239006